MNTHRKYIIPFQGLLEGEHLFEFEENSRFFTEFEQDLVKKGQFTVFFKLRKSETMLQGYFDIKGTVGLICDRSSEEFEEPIELNEKHIWKLGSSREELSDEIEVIPADEANIHIDQLIFDYIALALPIRKLHPQFRQEDGENDSEEGLLVYSTDKGTLEDAKMDETPIDPRWEVLAKLKNKL